MQLWTSFFCGALCVAACLPSLVQGQGTGAPIRNLRIPLEHYEDGKVRTQITAGTATMGENGSVTASDVKIEMYDRAGGLESSAEAGDCFVDREKESVVSTNTVRVTQKGVSITGTGFEWHAGEQSFKIHSRARVVFVRNPAMKLWDIP